MTKHNMRVFRFSPFFKLQNATYATQVVKNEMLDTYLLWAELFCYAVLVFCVWTNVGMCLCVCFCF